MKRFNMILSLVLVFCLTVICAPAVSADSAPVITVSQKSAVPGDSVAINIDISGNTGIMAMTFGIKYDADAFTFSGYAKGYINDCSVTCDPTLGLIRLVNCEKSDVSTNGTIVTINFTVNDTAAPENHKISVVNINYDYYGANLKGCFAKRGEIAVNPTVKTGGIKVGATCTNSPHLFGEWTVDVEPTCTREGLRSRTCSRCTHTENEAIDPKGHDYEAKWTVDREATKELAGEMSRHCKNCDAVTDVLLFELNEVENENTDIDNTQGSKNNLEQVEKLEDFKNLPTERNDGAIQDKDREPLFMTNGESNTAQETEESQESEPDENEYKNAEEIVSTTDNSEQKSVLQIIKEAIPESVRENLSLWIILVLIAVWVII